jgi:hypothetical protein
MSFETASECLDQETAFTLVSIGDLDEPLFFITGQALNDALANFYPFYSEGAPDFLGHIPCLIVGEMVLPPEFGRRGNQRFKACLGFRFYGWSTHKRLFSAYSEDRNLSNGD